MNKSSSFFVFVISLTSLMFYFITTGCKENNVIKDMFLEVSSEDISQEFYKSASSVMVPVKTNMNENDWKVEASDSWIVVTKQSIDGEPGISISVSDNDTGNRREGTVKLLSSANDVVITVTQYSGSDIVVEGDIAVIPSGGQASEA